MNRPASILGALVIAALMSCSETNYYIGRDPSGASNGDTDEDGGAPAASSGEASTAGGAGSSDGDGGAGGAVGHVASSTSAASTSAAATSASTAEATSSSSGDPEPVDCAAATVNTLCEGGACAHDGVCRPLVRCRAIFEGAERVINCADNDLHQMTVWYGADRLWGCRKQDGGAIEYPLACVPGEHCRAVMIVAGPSVVVDGRCE
jgi:hypothetical protein